MGCSGSTGNSKKTEHSLELKPKLSLPKVPYRKEIEWTQGRVIWFYHPDNRCWVPAVIRRVYPEQLVVKVYPTAGFESFTRHFDSLSLSLEPWKKRAQEPHAMLLTPEYCANTQLTLRENRKGIRVYSLASYPSTSFDPIDCPHVSDIDDSINASIRMIPSIVSVKDELFSSSTTFTAGLKVDLLVDNSGLHGWTVGVIYQITREGGGNWAYAALETPEKGIVGIKVNFRNAGQLFLPHFSRSYSPMKIPRPHQAVICNGTRSLITDVIAQPGKTARVCLDNKTDRWYKQDQLLPIGTNLDWRKLQDDPPEKIYSVKF